MSSSRIALYCTVTLLVVRVSSVVSASVSTIRLRFISRCVLYGTNVTPATKIQRHHAWDTNGELHEILKVIIGKQSYGIKTHPQSFRPNSCLFAQRDGHKKVSSCTWVPNCNLVDVFFLSLSFNFKHRR